MANPSFLHCHTCNKQVSTGFFPVQTDTPDKGIIVRAFIQCPECMEKETKKWDKRIESLIYCLELAMKQEGD